MLEALEISEKIGESVEGLYVTEADYWAHYYDAGDICYEWHNGLLEAKPVSDLAKTMMYRWFLQLLEQYLTVHPIATVTLLELGFRLSLSDKTIIRRPDLGIIRHDNPIGMVSEDRTYRGVFDLCIESLSDTSRQAIEQDTVVKKAEYAQIGVREYYILDNMGRNMGFYRLAQGGVYQSITSVKGVIESQVLPGFRFRIADLHHQPLMLKLVEDEVYQDFVMLDYQTERAKAEAEKAQAERERAKAEAEKAQAERERAKAEAEKVRAERERAKAEAEKAQAERERAKAEAEKVRAEQAETKAARLAAKLREMGISPDDLQSE